MQTVMRLRGIRIAPRKMRMVVDLVRGKKVALAKDILRFTKNKGARVLAKLLDSTISSAKVLGQGDESTLSIVKITVDEGSKLKRWMPRARGSAYPIQKKVSHITIIVDEAKGKKTSQKTKPEVQGAQVVESVKKKQAIGRDEKPKFKAVSNERKAPKIEKGVQRFFRRKAIG